MGWLKRMMKKLPVANRLARFHDSVTSEMGKVGTRQNRLEAEVRDLEWQLADQRVQTHLLQGPINDPELPRTRLVSTARHCRLTFADGRRLSILVPEPAHDPISQDLVQQRLPAIVPDRLQDRYLRPGMVVLDLGAHLGVWTLLAAARGCTVVAVEANPDNASLLRASVAANHFEAVHVVAAAVSDRPGRVRLLWSGPYGHVAAADQGEDGVDVPARTVDDILAELGIGHVDLVKMDVEGSEVRAVGGMANLLSRADAPAVYYESNGHCLHKFQHTCSDLRRLFARFGYANYRLVEGRRFRPVGTDDIQPESCIDYFATKTPPTDWPGWEVTAPQSQAEVRQEVVSMCGSGFLPQQEHLDRELTRAPTWLREDAGVQAARQGVEVRTGRPAA